MKKLFLFLFLAASMALAVGINAQNKSTQKNTAIERAPVNVNQSDGLNEPNDILAAYGGRFFGQNAAATSFFTKGFLNTSGTLANFGAGSASLYGAMEFGANGSLYCIAVAAGSQLQVLDTSTGTLTSLGAITGHNNEQVLGMAYNPVSSTMYITTIVSGSDKLYSLDVNTRVATLVGTTNQNMFGIAINSTGQCYAVTITDNLVSINLTTGVGTVIGPIGFDANFIQGLGFDKSTDTLWYAAYNNTLSRGELRTVNLTTGATTLIAPFTPIAEVCGFAIPSAPPPPPLGGNSLVLIHDSTVATSQTQRKADQDTLKKYLPRYVGNYTIQTFDTTTTLPNLSDYDAVFLVETSFDAAVTRYLGATARTQLKAWLNSGTSSSKKTIIAMGGDLGWNYSRTGSPSQDLGLSQDLLKYTYVVDNGNVSPNNSTTGSAIDAGNVRTYTTSPAGGGFWPDGCNPQSGGSILYYYTGGSTTTNVGGIGYIGTNYVSVAIFQDPRYFTNGNFGPVLYAAVQYAVTNGGIITGFNSGTISTIADRYELAQNYPNPFNPATTINFSIPKSGLVTLKIYDILGKEVATLVNEIRNAGSHTIDFNASALSSGTYFYRIESGDFKDVKKMMLLK